MIDLHIHFPMRLLGGVEAPRDVVKGMTRVRGREDGKLRAAVLAIAARLFNFRHWDATWRVTPQLLEQGQVSVACSVLYRPFSELDLDEPYGAPPESAYYPKLIELLDATEREIERTGGVIVRTPSDLERAQACAYVHCIEGGFHLGATPDEVAAHVHELAGRGVLYITLAHLFWRRVAANTPALPFLPDAVYNVLFPQAKGAGLSPLGEAAVRAMYACRDPRRHQPHARRRDRRDVPADRGARPRIRRRPARLPGDRLPRRLPLRRPEVQPQRRDDRADRGARRRDRPDLRPAPDQRRPAALGHQDAGRVARRARPPHRRDRRRTTSRSAPTSTASSSRRSAGSRPPPTSRRSPPRCALATPTAPSRSSSGNARRVIQRRFASAAP